MAEEYRKKTGGVSTGYAAEELAVRREVERARGIFFIALSAKRPRGERYFPHCRKIALGKLGRAHKGVEYLAVSWRNAFLILDGILWCAGSFAGKALRLK